MKSNICYFFRYLKWLLFERTYALYEGYNCGCCGKWIKSEFKVPTYKADRWWDTWGLCPDGCLTSEKEDCLRTMDRR